MLTSKLCFLLDVSNEVRLLYWYDMTPMGLQIKQLLKELLETREILGTTQDKLKTLESSISRRTVSSQSSIEVEVDGYQDKDIQCVSLINLIILGVIFIDFS